MSKKTIALIISLFVITVVLIILAVYPVTQRTTVSIPAPVVESNAETVLSFAPPMVSTASAISTASAEAFLMDTTILTGKNKVSAVQLELSYDPEALVNVDIEPGDFFTNPVVLLEDIDTEQGRI